MDINGMGHMMANRQQPNAESISTRLIDKADTDGDGALSQSELESLGDKADRFAGADLDENGLLNQQELVAKINEIIESGGLGRARSTGAKHSADDISEHLMSRLDTDGDGALSQSELEQLGDRAKRLEGADSDSDGLISLQELTSRISENIESRSQRKLPSINMAQQQASPLDVLIQQLENYDSEEASTLVSLLKNSGFDEVA